ncbi:hypothetical protein B0H66DRAFT_547908 [Apodospora peruviana]|uniref:Pentatricopeptide repeat domain-containing protein n=1 Tax=Apodospora peruviana TaxID=516989 RepID=A0AAE0IHR2_9PEZI|nr:hypothetical protein B0H66DRAFT_547908 [Apodospora peruviana]
MRAGPPVFRRLTRCSCFAPSTPSSGIQRLFQNSPSQLPFPRVYPPCHYSFTQNFHAATASTSRLLPQRDRSQSFLSKAEWLIEAPADVPEVRGLSQSSDKPVIGSQGYGIWHWLSEDEEKLCYEADVGTNSGHSRLVDFPNNENDISLWLCILDFRARKDGVAGVAAVMEGIMRRETLRKTDGEVAERFWTKILSVAVEHETLLHDVWTYAEWLYHSFGVRWPNIWSITMSSFIKNQQPMHAQRWHVLLYPDFGPDGAEFVGFLKQFITAPDDCTQYILRTLYILTPHRGLYDEIIPYLFSRGHRLLAHKWRRLFVKRADFPTTSAARQFIRFQAGYYPEVRLARREIQAALLDKSMPDESLDTADKTQNAALRDTSTTGKTRPALVDRFDVPYLVGKELGETFGIKEKPYNDELGARLFASSWLSIDTTIEMVHIMGFKSIGHLSLQSIALREPDCDQLKRRTEQLRALGISISDSSYAQALQHFAAVGDHASLDSLLRSDWHPDIFDDSRAQRYILDYAVAAGDWRQFEVLMAVRLALSRNLAASLTEQLLRMAVEHDRRMTVLRILDSLGTRVAQISELTSHSISMHIICNVSPHVWGRPPDKRTTYFYSELCKRLLPMQFPLAAKAVSKVLQRLGRDGFLKDYERLAVGYVQRYVDIQQSGQPMFYVHISDLPYIVKDDGWRSEVGSTSNFRAIPADLLISNPKHPVSLVFTCKMQNGLIRWCFRRASHPLIRVSRAHVFDLMEAKDFHFARGLRILAMLRDKGADVNRGAMIRGLLLRISELFWSGRLLALYGSEMRSRGIVTRTGRAEFTLSEVLRTCEEAWYTGPKRSDVSEPEPVSVALGYDGPRARVVGRAAGWLGDKPRGPQYKRLVFMGMQYVHEHVRIWGRRWAKGKGRQHIFARRIKTDKLPMGKKRRPYLFRRRRAGYRWVLGYIPRSK